MNLFTYGTLMAPDIMEDVSGYKLRCVPAVLSGFERYCVRDEHYPGMVKKSGRSVQGVLYLDVPVEGVARLDRFEGEMYDRVVVEVKIEQDSGMVEAMTYVFKDEYRHLLTAQVWNFDRFLKEGKRLFEQLYVGYGELNGEV